MKLRHFSKTPVIAVYSTAQNPEEFATYRKPRGFWVSDEDDSSWCSDATDLEHGVTLAGNANILYLSDEASMVKFTEKYGRDWIFAEHNFGVGIDWLRVAEDFQGIIITPYVWRCRMTLDWYYVWDCASGCIWDAAAIASVGLLVETRERASSKGCCE